MRSKEYFAVHPSYRPTISADQITTGTPWPSAKYMAFPVPAGFDEIALRAAGPFEWFMDGQNGKALYCGSYGFIDPGMVRRILRKREQWPTPRYAAMLLPQGMVKTGELADPRDYTGSGTHFLCCDGGAVILQTTVCPELSLDDPRRYILRRARKWELVETGERDAAAGPGFYIGEQDDQPHESFFGIGHCRTLRCTEIE